jgi:hypothetical protein
MLPNERRCIVCNKVKKLSQMRGPNKNVCKSCFNSAADKIAGGRRKGKRKLL